jgi:release factor glutamine methyltransferase
VDRLRRAGCVFAEEEAELLLESSASAAHLESLVVRRVAGEPLEHVLGWAAFGGQRIGVAPGVFVPRRRTELVVREAARLGREGAVVVDLCCGTGAIGVATARALGKVELHCADIDPVAVACARPTVEAVGGKVHLGDLLEPLPARLRGRVDLVLACPPYVPSDAVALMPAEARDHEPRRALDGGTDGLDVVRRIAAAVGDWLAPGAHLLVEAGAPQGPDVRALFIRHGLVPRVVTDADLGALVVVGSVPG